MTVDTPKVPRDYRRIVTERVRVTRSSDTAKPGDLILARDRVLRVPAA